MAQKQRIKLSEVMDDSAIARITCPPVKYRETLYYFDGALIMALEDEQGFLYYCHWIDCDKQNQYWAVTRIAERTLDDIKANAIPLIRAFAGDPIYVVNSKLECIGKIKSDDESRDKFFSDFGPTMDAKLRYEKA
jgi:hypothetical protein